MYFDHDFGWNWYESACIGANRKKNKKKKSRIGTSEERHRESDVGAAVLELHPCFLASTSTSTI